MNHLSDCCLGYLIMYYRFYLVYFPKCQKIAHPYIIALSSIPTALALMIIWFKLIEKMKIVLHSLYCFYYCFSTYAKDKENFKVRYFFQNQPCYQCKTTLLDAHSASLDWVIQSLKLNAGLCFVYIPLRIYTSKLACDISF